MLGVLLISLVGCSVVENPIDLYGHYRMSLGNKSFALDLRRDGTYTETVTISQGRVRTTSNKWILRGSCTNFGSFLVPKESTPFGTPDADGLVQSEWCLGPEKHFGKIVLILNPDRPGQFEMDRK